jgi:hypothetical protein
MNAISVPATGEESQTELRSTATSKDFKENIVKRLQQDKYQRKETEVDISFIHSVDRLILTDI